MASVPHEELVTAHAGGTDCLPRPRAQCMATHTTSDAGLASDEWAPHPFLALPAAVAK